VAVAAAYLAAWNAHDLDAVLALFAPDAVVRERWGPVPPEVWETREPQVVRAYLEGSHDGDNYDTHGFAWVTGRPAIAAWAAARFAQHHRFQAGPYRGAGDTVSWRYQEFVDPFQRTPGASPLDGDAEAVVQGGRIAVLSLVQAPASVRRQRDEAATAFDRAMATQRASPLQGELGGAPRRPLGGADPTDAAWPLALSGLAVLAARRRRRAPQR
jgi:MYXO-CTERM domain-containing protein